MKANELMINDWVEWMGKCCKVDLPLLMTEYQDNIDSNYVKPIPITAEILKKNGWVLCDDCEYVSPFDIDFKTCLRLFGFGEYYNERGFGVNAGFVQLRKGLKYVHELQNLLSSLGMSEVADNFKVE